MLHALARRSFCRSVLCLLCAAAGLSGLPANAAEAQNAPALAIRTGMNAVWDRQSPP